jgi:hypothetical protein
MGRVDPIKWGGAVLQALHERARGAPRRERAQQDELKTGAIEQA